MKAKQFVFILIALLLFLNVLTLYAQRAGRPLREEMQRVQKSVVGVHGNYDFDRENFGMGIHGQIPLVRFLKFASGGDLYFGDETSWQLNADIMLGRILHPGGGLAVVDGSLVGSESAEVGYNLFLAVQPMMLRRHQRLVRPFAEVRWTFANGERIFRLAFGVSIPI